MFLGTNPLFGIIFALIASAATGYVYFMVAYSKMALCSRLLTSGNMAVSMELQGL